MIFSNPSMAQSTLPDILASVALLSTLLLAWWLTRSTLKRRRDLPSQVARRWTANVRNGLVLVAIVGLLMIWAPQLRTFALSLTAFAVALVIAMKELILCLSGSAFRTFTRAYTIGDLVQIGDHRGEVVDISLLSTRLKEIRPEEGSIIPSGQSVMIPHSLLFSQPARIIARNGLGAAHAFELVFETDLDLFSRLGELEQIAVSAVSATQRQDEGPETPRPRLAIGTTDLGRIRLQVEFRAALDQAEAIQQAITVAVGSFVLSQPV